MNKEETVRVEHVDDGEHRREDDHFVTECGLTRAELRELVAEMIG